MLLDASSMQDDKGEVVGGRIAELALERWTIFLRIFGSADGSRSLLATLPLPRFYSNCSTADFI